MEHEYKNKYFGVASHPFAKSKDGYTTHIIRTSENLTEQKWVPLFDHHDYDSKPIGAAKLMFVPSAGNTASKERSVLVLCEIHTDLELPPWQGLSLGYAEASRDEIHKTSVGVHILELSIVDIPHIYGCRIYDADTFLNSIKELRESAKELENVEAST